MFNLKDYRKESTKLNIVVTANLLLKKLFKWQLYLKKLRKLTMTYLR